MHNIQNAEKHCLTSAFSIEIWSYGLCRLKVDVKSRLTTFSDVFQGWNTLGHACIMRGHSGIHCSVSLSTQFNPPTAMNVDCDLLRKNLCPRKRRSRCVLLWFPVFSNFWSHGWRWWLAIGYNQRSMVLIFNSKLTDSVECSLKQPRSSEFCWLYNILRIWRGWERETTEEL